MVPWSVRTAWLSLVVWIIAASVMAYAVPLCLVTEDGGFVVSGGGEECCVRFSVLPSWLDG